MSIGKPTILENHLNSDQNISESIDPKPPQTPLGSGGIATHKHYWDMRKRDIEKRTND